MIDRDQTMLCRKSSGIIKISNDTAGKWGNQDCDLNQLAFKSLLQFIKNEIKPNVVFWGGDSAPHDIDSETQKGLVYNMIAVTDQIVKELKGI